MTTKKRALSLVFLFISFIVTFFAFAEEVRLVKEGGVYHLPVKINNAIELKFVVDTGASDVLIPADVALTLMRTETISNSDFLGKDTYKLADGTIAENSRLILRSLQIGSVVIKNIVASVGPVKGSLLLGQSALEKLEPWRMETKRGFFIFDDHTTQNPQESKKESNVEALPIEKGVIYFAGELPPTDNIPPEAPLCYKFQVSSPEDQLKKLKKKYPDIFDDKIQNNTDGSKKLVAKRRDEKGKVINYYYSTSPTECNEYQKNQLNKSPITPPLSAPAYLTHHADEWLFIVSTEMSMNYYLPSSIKKEGSYIKVWEKTEYHKPKQIYQDLVKTVKNYNLYDCKSSAYKMINFVGYDINGKVLRSGNYDYRNDPWEVILPQSVGELIINALCRN